MGPPHLTLKPSHIKQTKHRKLSFQTATRRSKSRTKQKKEKKYDKPKGRQKGLQNQE